MQDINLIVVACVQCIVRAAFMGCVEGLMCAVMRTRMPPLAQEPMHPNSLTNC